MKTTELRIGNYLIDRETKQIRKVKGIYSHRIITTFEGTDTDALHISEFEPILLTEEILVKAGFEINNKKFIINRFLFIWKYNYWYVVDAYEKTYMNKIEFVHELQNFIFIMEGNELNINL